MQIAGQMAEVHQLLGTASGSAPEELRTTFDVDIALTKQQIEDLLRQGAASNPELNARLKEHQQRLQALNDARLRGAVPIKLRV